MGERMYSVGAGRRRTHAPGPPVRPPSARPSTRSPKRSP